MQSNQGQNSGKISPVKSDRLPASDHHYLSATNKAMREELKTNNRVQSQNIPSEELEEILNEITFEPVPGKESWGKIGGKDKQFIDGQVQEYGKTEYVKFGENSLNGFLKITCVNADLSRNVQTFGRMDPYVLITNGTKELKTKTHDDAGMKPVWNEDIHIPIIDKTRPIDIAVRDEETFSDRDIGTLSIRAD